MVNRVYSMIGISTKAGKVASGEFSTEEAIKKGRAKLVILAEDASDNTKKAFTDMCTYYGVPIYFYGDKESLGASCGKSYRASLAIQDEGLGRSIEKLIKELQK